MKIHQNQTTKNTQGFTIIEVVLVLAIAGLIFLMVFLALPALQRGQRDAQRKNDVSRVHTQVESYKSNSRGLVPASLVTNLGASGKSFVQQYLSGSGVSTAGGDYLDPSTGSGYNFLAVNTPPAAAGDIGYYPGKICPTDGTGTPTAAGAVARNYSLVVYLEGQSAPYCSDSR